MATSSRKPRRQINGRFPTPPFWLVSAGMIFACFAILVLATAVRARNTHSPLPRVHLIQDMDNQVKYKTQHENDIFVDGRASRPQVLGTVAFGHLDADDHLYRGYSRQWNAAKNAYDVSFLSGFPSSIKIDDALLVRGQQKFNTYCMPCHGYDGNGVGPVASRAGTLSENPDNGMKWVKPSNLVDGDRRKRVEGHIYNTIVNGIRNMAPYGSAIQDPTDRWAIVAYVRALQDAQPLPADAPAAPTSQNTGK